MFQVRLFPAQTAAAETDQQTKVHRQISNLRQKASLRQLIISSSDVESDPTYNRENTKKKKKKKIPLKLICSKFLFFIWAHYLCALNWSVISILNDILFIFIDFYVSFQWFWLIFCYLDPSPDPGGQNDLTDLQNQRS